MTTAASTLLDFILGLFRDEEAAKAFEADPDAALASAGFPDVDPATVHALMPVMADSSPTAYRSGGHDDDDKGHGGHAPARDEDYDKDDGHWHKVWRDDEDDCHDDHDDEDQGRHDHDHKGHDGHKGHDYAGHGQDAAVIHNVRYVENNYSHTDIDYEIEIENAIWAGTGATVVTGDDNVVAGLGGVAAGDDVEGNAINSGNEDNDTLNVNSGNTVDSGNVIGNEDNDTTTTNTNNGNIGSNVASGDGTVEDNDVDVDVEVDDVTVVSDSFNGATIAGDDVDQSTDVEIEDSLNGNQLAGGDITDVEVEDSLNGNNLAGDDVNEDSLVIEESLNGNNLAGDDVNEIEESVVVDDSLNNNDVAVAGDDVEDVDQSSDLLSDNFSDNEVLSDNTAELPMA